MSNILQQLTNSEKKDPDLVKFDKLKREVGPKLKQLETDETVLKFQVISLAETLEKIMINHDQQLFVNQIFTLLSRYFKSEYDISQKSALLLWSFFEDYPQYTRISVKNNSPYIMSDRERGSTYDVTDVLRSEGSMPEENKLYRVTIDNCLSLIDKLDFSRLTKDQCLIIDDKLQSIVKNKQHELEHNYKLLNNQKNSNKQRSTNTYNPYDDEPEVANPGNKITQILIKIRNQFNEMIAQSQYIKPPSPELENELWGQFGTFYKVLRFITDKKHKASVVDWSNMSLATNDYNSHYASSNIKFKAPLCAKCKDRSEDLDPVGKKHIYQHIQMYSEYQMNREYDKKSKKFFGDPYIWRCPRCKGTSQKIEIMSVERINESLVYMNSLLIDIVNKSDIYKAVSIYFEELIKPQRLVAAHTTSNKLLSKK